MSINVNNAWFELGKLFSWYVNDDELDLFFKKNNLYSSSDGLSKSFKEGTFEKMTLLLDSKGVNTSEIKTLFLEYTEEIPGLNKYYFFWGHSKENLKIAEVLTFSEASELWGLADSTLRKMATSDRLVEGVDYRKSGKSWIITKSAMERLYGKLAN